MSDSQPLDCLLDRAKTVFTLAGELASTFRHELEQHGEQIDPSDWGRHVPLFEKFCSALLELRDAIRHPPNGFAPIARQLMQTARLAREIRNTVTRTGGFTAYRDYIPELNTVSLSGWNAVKHTAAAQQTDDPFAFVDEVAFSLLDRFPETRAGHLAFLEWVRDEVRYAAEAKRKQLERGYSNQTINLMVHGIKWAEAKVRLAALRDVPVLVRSNTSEVLSRELTADTVEQIEPLFTQAVNGVRSSIEHARTESLIGRLTVVSTAGELWKAYAKGKEPCFQASAIEVQPQTVVPDITCPNAKDEAQRNALDRAHALVIAEGGDKAAAMEKLIARVQLQADLDNASVLRMPLAEFVAAATGRPVDRRPEPVRTVDAVQRLLENAPNLPAYQEKIQARLEEFSGRIQEILNGPEYNTPANWGREDWRYFHSTIRNTLESQSDERENDKVKLAASTTNKETHDELLAQSHYSEPAAFQGGWMGDVALAKALRVHSSQLAAFRAKLSRMRKQRELSMDDWQEIETRKRNEPKILYRSSAPAIVNIAKRYRHPK
jgi:hypothetical protein